MPVSSVMASESQAAQAETAGAPIAKDAIDPDLVKLSRKRPKIGIVTAAGLVFLCTMFVVRLWPDRRFSGHDATPTKVTVADIVAGKIDLDAHISVQADPVVAHAIRTTEAKGNLGLRVAPARGSDEKLWLVVTGDGWEKPNTLGYVGRLRALHDLPFATSVEDYANTHPRVVFATGPAVRAGMASNKVAVVGGEVATIADKDRVAIDVVDPKVAIIVASLNQRLPDAAAWKAALERAGLAPANEQVHAELREVRYEIAAPDAVATTTKKLEQADLWAARVDPVTRHFEGTWAALKASPAGSLMFDKATVPESEVELVGLYAARGIPDGAYAVIVGEKPADFWYVLPITIGLALIALVFVWALARAIKRDLLTPTTTPAA